ncbi:MAG: carboxypeptidase-like regulatory domain-containing protein [Ferruginibacter sp.]
MESLQKKWYYCCCLALLFFSLTAHTQISISGRVVDQNGDIALAGASVYFNNTTIGAYTNPHGDFHFEINDLLNTEMVISFAGYEVLMYKLNVEQVKGKRIVFKLQPKAEQQINKMVLTDVVRKRFLEIFQQSFLGITKEAKKSSISNEGSIYFARGNNSTSFLAYADTPLVIINNMLGYKISFNLLEFWYDDATGQSYTSGYTRYEEFGDDKKWIKNRQNCYYGSSLHFYRSLITNQLYEQGFGTFLIQEVTDSIHKSVLTAEQARAAAEIVTTVPVTAQQILFIDSTNNFSIRVNGRLLVQYFKDPSSKRYLKRNISTEDGPGRGTESYILFKAASIGLNNAGVLSDASQVDYVGYWTYEKAANSLPYDYKPE